MRHVTYLAVLVGCACGALWVEPVLHVNVLRRWRRLGLTVGVIVLLFGGWDVAAIAAGHWHYDQAWVTGLSLPGHLPIEELLFFIVVPSASILGFEAVRAVRGSRSPAGDEQPRERAVDERIGGDEP
ncbi:MAG TPA: lycopene cyclase domain-containing protein [Micromonosporaceae bacterium]|jgi:lycopene cyclase domain-containing protein|nr:lycopene cyclase domain-containing protein [Micromonosporaceae bacterium]